ncbi:unannotated protein [freshwater metagenome]|uniref:UDP-MurNAc-pentapeptide synthetase n=1 Tax=freshwater metagenome TaxID=449393 RepID=A0A6J7B563_9ZZZZ|nr:UDP-N-acetylmuramoyl-tripeptide--D-alanyl-D-alanine ligase [Actinomycetota bacterium]
MIPISTQELAQILSGTLHASADIIIDGECVIDSRKMNKGGIFFALQGESVTGLDFAADAFSKGAALVIGEKQVDGPCIVVEDVTKALGHLAAHVRSKLTNLIVIAITGSEGKTTTKDLLSWICAIDGETVSTFASYNNEIGLPLTLLSCTPSTKYCIVEMGARHVGDIAHLCQIADPRIGIVLKVGSAHLGEFGTIEAIAKTKAELIEYLPENGTAILGNYDPYTPAMTPTKGARVITFGQGHQEDVRASDVEIREGRAHFDLVTPIGRAAVGLRLVGGHQVSNALAAAAAATTLGISLDSIAGGLSTAEIQSKWRMQLHELPGLLLINDAYNANVDSTSAALRALALFAQERGGQSWAFLGKMLELGESSAQEHQRIGTLAQAMGIDHLVCVGAPEYTTGLTQDDEMRIHKCLGITEAAMFSDHFAPGDVVLVKASRAEKLEVLADLLEQSWMTKIGGDQ